MGWEVAPVRAWRTSAGCGYRRRSAVIRQCRIGRLHRLATARVLSFKGGVSPAAGARKRPWPARSEPAVCRVGFRRFYSRRSAVALTVVTANMGLLCLSSCIRGIGQVGWPSVWFVRSVCYRSLSFGDWGPVLEESRIGSQGPGAASPGVIWKSACPIARIGIERRCSSRVLVGSVLPL